MNFNRIIIAALAICSLSLVSCKKDEETTPFSFQGNVEFEEYIPSYVTPGQVIKLTPSGAKKDPSDPDTPVIKYSFLASPFMTKRDTTSVWSFTVPDSLCTIKLSVYASASGYYSLSSEYAIVVVDPARSLTDVSYNTSGGGTFIDQRDSRVYPYTPIAGKDWMEKNLAYCGFGKAYMSVNDSGYDSMTDIFGMYYTWEEALQACPEGWRLPSDQDWTEMCQTLTDTPLTTLQTFPGIASKLMSNARLNNNRLWTYYTITKPDPTASYMNLLPVGFANISGDTYYFESSLSSAAFWTSTEYDSEKAYVRYLYNNAKNADVQAHPLYKDFVATTIRCIRDSQ